MTTLLNIPQPPVHPSSSPVTGPNGSISTNNHDQLAPNQYQGFRLEQLSLSSFPNEPQVFASPSLSQLTHLSINDCDIKESDIKFLFGADAGVLKNLTHLDLTKCQLDDNALLT